MGTICKNLGTSFRADLLEGIDINLTELNKRTKEIISQKNVTNFNRKVWALKALMLTDLTTLSGDDTPECVRRLCIRAAFPLKKITLDVTEIKYKIHTAAVCVYPSRVKDAFKCLNDLKQLSNIRIASVATGFPSGLYPIETRCEEVKLAIKNGANEIDIVIDRSLALQGKWLQIYEEIKFIKEHIPEHVHLKTILGVGELGTMENVYKASMVAMMAGSDFIKTSTGKETVNATLPIGLVMMEAIKDYKRMFGFDIGFKPAGGIRTTTDAINWIILIKEILGAKYLSADLFRFGASGLLDDIEKVLSSA